MKKQAIISGLMCLCLCGFEFSCKKKSDCDAWGNNLGTFILKDSMVHNNGTTNIFSDTVIVDMPPSFNGKTKFNSFGESSVFLLTEGCANNFTLQVLSYGSGTYSGSGSFNGQTLNLNVHYLAAFTNDTADYYCSGIKQ